MSKTSFDTLAVHAGEDRRANFGAVSVPIYTSSVYAFTDADEGAAIHNNQKAGYYYGRLGNPTQAALEKAMAELENGQYALSFASGMAAVSAAILTIVKSGDHIVAPASMYSTTTKFLDHLNRNFGIETSYVDAAAPSSYETAIRANTKLFWIETPSNPILNITDLSALTDIARRAGIKTIADNTFATPYNQRPLDLGVDVVVHSATKYLGGHSDLTAGVIVGDAEIVEKARLSTTQLYGGNIAPQVAWLVLRGIKTLSLRTERHNSNAFALANMLSEHPNVERVYYPGLSSHRNHDVAAKQMRGFGGMIGIDVGGLQAGKSVVNNVRLCTLGTSLGGAETLIQHSASMTHAGIPKEQRLAAGISDGLLRLSVGIEGIDDLAEDLRSALDKI